MFRSRHPRAPGRNVTPPHTHTPLAPPAPLRLSVEMLRGQWSVAQTRNFCETHTGRGKTTRHGIGKRTPPAACPPACMAGWGGGLRPLKKEELHRSRPRLSTRATPPFLPLFLSFLLLFFISSACDPSLTPRPFVFSHRPPPASPSLGSHQRLTEVTGATEGGCYGEHRFAG